MKVTLARRKLFALVRHFSLAVLPLATFLSLFLAPAPAAAVTVPLVFDGPENTFDTSLDLSGNLFANGNGSVFNTKNRREEFKFTAPFNHPLSAKSWGDPFSVHVVIFDDGASLDVWPNGQVTNIIDLQLDLLQGQTVDFVMDSAVMTTNSSVGILKNLSLDLKGTLTYLQFNQIGAASFTGGGSTGVFAIPGTLSAVFDEVQPNLFGLYDLPFENPLSINMPFELQGAWTTSGPPGNTKVALDGAFNAALPLSLHTNFNTIMTDILSMTYHSTMDLTASVLISGSYHFETTLVIPEPGSVALLLFGLAALAPLARRRVGRP